METKIPVYEAKIRETDNTGIFAMSFVECPANDSLFVALAKTAVKLSLDRQKQIITGAVLVPNQNIYRNEAPLGEYFLRFTAEDIEKIAQKMMRTGVALSTTTHQHESALKGNYLVECWTVTDPKNDKANALGLGELPKGTLVASYKIGNAAYWRTEVLAGKVKGFSIEGLFNFKNVQMAKVVTKPAAAPKLTALGLALKAVGINVVEMDSVADAKALATVAKEDQTDSGTPYLVFELQGGGEIDVDADGFATMDGEQAPAGDHTLTDGNVITIDDNGDLVVTSDTPSTPDPAAPPAALSAKEKAVLAKQRNEAKERATKLAKLGAFKPADDEKSKTIAQLKKQLAELEAEPSVPPAKPKTEGGADKEFKDMTQTEKMAHVIKQRYAAQNK